jgi:hypothetical protein
MEQTFVFDYSCTRLRIATAQGSSTVSVISCSKKTLLVLFPLEAFPRRYLSRSNATHDARHAPDTMRDIIKRFGDNPLFQQDLDASGQESLHLPDIMISDWSGAALDYAFGLGKPVLFIDLERKVNNPDYKKIDLTPFEVTVRTQVGEILSPEDLAQLPQAVTHLVSTTAMPTRIGDVMRNNVFNPGYSAAVGARALG